MHNLSLGLSRLVSVFIVILFFSIAGEAQTYKVYSSYLMAHYALALVYFLNLKGIVSKGGQHYIALVGLLFISVLLVQFQPVHILVYFGIHYFLTELYLTRFLGLEESFTTKLVRSPFLVLAYIYFIKEIPAFANYSSNSLMGLVAVSFIIILAWNILKKKSVWYEAGLFGGVLVTWGLDLAMPAYNIIFYHIVLWSFLPFIKFGSRQGGKLLLIHLILFTTFYFVGVKDDLFMERNGCLPEVCIGFFAFLHITLSFGTSRLNPTLIQKLMGYTKS